MKRVRNRQGIEKLPDFFGELSMVYSVKVNRIPGGLSIGANE